MPHQAKPQIEAQLHQLVKQGAGAIRRAALSNARSSALGRALYMLWCVPLSWVLMLLWASNPSLAQAGIVSLAGVALAALTYALNLALVASKTTISRQQALALYDRQLNFKDDLQTLDEFSRITNPSAFVQAAIWASQDSLTLASKHRLHPLAHQPLRLTSSQIMQLALFALVSLILAATMLLPQTINHKQAPDSTVAQMLAGTIAANAQTPDPLRQVTAKPASAMQTPSNGQPESLPDSPDSTSHTQASAASGGLLANNRSASSSAAAANTDLHKPGQSHSQSSQFQRPNVALSNAHSAQSPSAAASQGQSDAAHGQLQPDSQQDTPAKSNPHDSAATDKRNPLSDEQRVDKAQLANNPMAGQQGLRNNKQAQPNNRKSPQQQQSQGNQQDSNSQNNNTKGDDAQKKSRGINELMLAVPMEDEFIGTPGPGQEKSTSIKVSSGDKPRAPGVSDSRGQTKQAAQITQQTITQAWEKHLLNEFFRQQHTTAQHNENSNDD